MSDGLIKVFIGCGWVAAGIASLVNLLVATRTGGLNFPNLIITIACLGIAYGIFRRSRMAALAMFIVFAITRVLFYRLAMQLAPQHGGTAFITSFWISTSVFMFAFLLAVIGTFAWHTQHPTPGRKFGSV
jgi:uncharacterized membrane protein